MAVGAAAGTVDPKTHRKWVWAFINAIANLVNVVVSNREDGADYVSFVMMPCDSAARPMLASVRKRKKMLSKNYLSFSIPVLTPLPPTAPSTAD